MREERGWKRPVGDLAGIIGAWSFWAAHDNWIVQLLCALVIATLAADLIAIPVSALRERRHAPVQLVPAPVISLSPGDDFALIVGAGVLDIDINGRRYRAEYGDDSGAALEAVQAELEAGRTITDLNAFLAPALVFTAVSR
ncbi:hypothetical protein ACFY36_45055 [Actinoplanes sp. NPDC000266]